MKPDPTIPQPFERPDRDPDDPPCCIGTANGGNCTCWSPVFDHQAPVQADAPDRVAEAMCHGCAFRRGSGAQLLAEMEEMDVPPVTHPTARFHCHEGLRKVIAWVHEDGRRVDVPADAWSHVGLQVGGRFYAADGLPARVCFGWQRAREKALAER